MKYKHLFIDADNTLFDYSAAERFSLLETFKSTGINCGSDDIVSNYNSINTQLWMEFEKGDITLDFLRVERFKRLFAVCGKSSMNEDDYKDIAQKYLDHLGASSHMIEGAAGILEKLSRNFILTLITNGISKVQRSRLKAAGIEKYFKELVISEEIGFKKPEKEFFDEAMRQSGNPVKGEILVIGDSLSSDILGGINYSLDTCWFNPEGKENTSGITPLYEISSLDELFKIVDFPDI
ncbi:MAG: YjjG family noncanonical pyrimidine nucleotidase [Spirochaetia bacterium]|jgi:2-haloacid dehalogenase|nr:YjjG family noncanonical pyrimidine nucleotidase [Spirochaetia bacterium]